MSYDLQVWCVRRPDLPDALPEVTKWCEEGECWVRSGRGWQIVVSPPAETFDEDVPEGVAAALPGIRYLVSLTLEPLGAPTAAFQVLGKITRAIAKSGHGVTLDPQEDTVTLASGVKRYVPQKRPDRFSLLNLSWWFNESPLQTGARLDKFVHLLEKALPEALPKRYGLYEPPQHVYSETGREHFLAFLAEHISQIVVWYPNRPVMGVDVSCYDGPAPEHLGFRVNHVEIAVETACLSQPGWQQALSGFWRKASDLIQPFYGEVRTLSGFSRMGATYGTDMETEVEPVRAGFWRGIPRILGHAAVIGPLYRELWPDFIDGAEVSGKLAFRQTPDWNIKSGLSEGLSTPTGIAQRHTPKWVQESTGGWTISWCDEYPEVWPFSSGASGNS